ncbi:glucosidase II beta subunit-like protein-domain-containing protein [Phycomyces nitens]|nr:glucosidase II beta subunit-like protein-domain-containing protein [Phycomyces nitens]
MNKLIVFLALQTFVSITTASSFVYEDVLAYPRYRVSLSENKIPESVVFGNSPNDATGEISMSSESHLLQDENNFMMMSTYGQPFLCTIPNVDAEGDKEKRQRQIKEHMKQENTHGSIERGLQLLEPLSKGCLYFTLHGYWTYEYCHGQHVRQFHEERIAQGENGQPDTKREGASFYLGLYPGTTESSDLVQKNTVKQGTNIQQRSKSTPETSLHHVGDKRYLVQKWGGGTQCDITKEPRTIEVQYHCDLQVHDRITMFQEIKTCQYQIVISTPRLCDELVLSSQSQSETYPIKCDPIVPDQTLAEESKQNSDEWDKIRVETNVETDTFVVAATEAATVAIPEDTNSFQVVGAARSIAEDEDEDEKELRKAIADLTAQIDQLQRQVRESTLPQAVKEMPVEDPGLAYFYVDKQGKIVPVDEQTKKLFKNMEGVEDRVEKWANEEVPEEQKKNKEAYERIYAY